MGHVILNDLADQIGMDRSHCRRYVKRIGIEPCKIRDKRGVLMLAITEAQAGAVRNHRTASGFGSTAAPVNTDAGWFYVIYLVPDLDPRRVKLGFTQDLAARLATHRCSAPTAKIAKAWPCKRQWEAVAIETVSHGSEHMLNECYSGDVDRMIDRARAFFLAMPEV